VKAIYHKQALRKYLQPFFNPRSPIAVKIYLFNSTFLIGLLDVTGYAFPGLSCITARRGEVNRR